MGLRDLIDAEEVLENDQQKATQKAKGDVKAYLLKQTVTVKDMYDIVAVEYDNRSSSSGQVSTWDILYIAKRAILEREDKNEN